MSAAEMDGTDQRSGPYCCFVCAVVKPVSGLPADAQNGAEASA
jgi:hypothetical protein